VGSDAGKILAAQGLRAVAYGFSSVLLGASLEARGWSSVRVGVFLTAILVGTGTTSLVLARYGERLGRRRAYALLFAGLAVSGTVLGLTAALIPLMLVALTGTVSTDVVESGPFTSLEQAMLPSTVPADRVPWIFGRYNAVATLAGSFGALAAGGPELLRHVWPGLPANQRFFLLLIPVAMAGLLLARSLSPAVEAPPANEGAPSRGGLGRSRRKVAAISALIAVDSFGGGFVVQAFIAFWFRRRFGVSLEVLGMLFFAVGLLQTGSFLVAARLSSRIGLLNTMVFTHLPSNVLLALIPLAPNLGIAVALLLARFALSQMDVPARQAFIAALVDPSERTAAAAYTNTVRYAVRPFGALLGGLSQRLAFGAPFVLGGAIKSAYDVALYTWFRKVPLDPVTPAASTAPAEPTAPGP
jgi:predicted MFS family arabinose efflux permease